MDCGGCVSNDAIGEVTERSECDLAQAIAEHRQRFGGVENVVVIKAAAATSCYIPSTRGPVTMTLYTQLTHILT